MARARRGFTLVELVVVCLLIGILAAFGIPQYLKSVESGKADSAAGLLNMVATTNRMYALDHKGLYVTGSLTAACHAAAPTPCDLTAGNPCNLVWCKYLADDDWEAKPYVVAAADPAGACSLGLGAGNLVACTLRRNGSSPGTNSAPYNTWGYMIDAAGTVACYPSGTSACSGANDPPAPAR